MRMQVNKKIEKWKSTWRWWHYTKIFFGFFVWLILPVTIILSSFYFYPLSTVSVPSVLMILVMLILLAVDATPNCWRRVHKSFGTLIQLMMCVCYILYFALID
jgi:membrane protein YdbS with pleckstrin-like domain